MPQFDEFSYLESYKTPPEDECEEDENVDE